jgi:hypothetical protein
MRLWINQDEIDLFKKSLDEFSSVEDLFYRSNSNYYAYIPKGIRGMKNEYAKRGYQDKFLWNKWKNKSRFFKVL